ncbi:MAG: DUF2092 domain-containing protein [Gammaproteobacteria bacterium]|nr:DUF2092 domain-containing protein [Gammaproteobacteria bacterium]
MHYRLSTSRYLLSVYLIMFSLISSSVFAEEADIEPKADKILKQMSQYLAGLKQFEITAQSTVETVIDSGQKIMLEHANKVVIKRPNKLFASRLGDVAKQSFYYDGKSLTVNAQHLGFYASVDAHPTLSETLDYTLTKFNITTPGVDLLHSDSYERLSNELISAFYVSKSMINGVECHHLAFRNSEVDWQIWIQTGDKPLPVKYVINSRWITSSPSYEVNMKWNINPDISDSLFDFIPPKGAEKIDLLSVSPSS